MGNGSKTLGNNAGAYNQSIYNDPLHNQSFALGKQVGNQMYGAGVVPNAQISGNPVGMSGAGGGATGSSGIDPAVGNNTNYMPYVAAGLGALQTGVEIAGDYRQTSKFDVDEATMQDRYNPYYQPPTFMKQETPQEISEGTGKRAALNYGMKGAATGAQIGTLVGGPVGTLVGAGVGALAGGITGAFKGRKAEELRSEWDQNQKDRFNKYLQADRVYGDITGTMKRANEKAKSFSQRGMNTTPIYNSSIYGYMR